MDRACTFCRIVKKETSTKFLYENDTLVVFEDINPHAPIHLLIVPKKHIRSINDLMEEDREIVAEMLMIAKKMASEQRVSKSGYRLFFNVESGGGQVIFHLHLHLVGGW
jgi:histidine triad (HIT) family protein